MGAEPGAVAPSDVTRALAMLWASSLPGRLMLLPGQGKQAGVDMLTEALRARRTDELAGRIAAVAVAWYGGTPEAAEKAHEWAKVSPVLAPPPHDVISS